MSREYKGMYYDTDGQTAYVKTNKNRTEVVTEHAHTDRSTCNTLVRYWL